MLTRLGGALAAAALLCTACTGDDPTPGPTPSATTPGPLDRDDSAAEPTWTADLDVIGQPVVAGDTAVVLARARGDAVRIVALDVETGEERWSRPWSPGGVPPGFAMEPIVVSSESGASAVFSVPPRDLGTEEATIFEEPIATVDVATGDEIRRTKPLELATPLSTCAEGRACFDDLSGSAGRRVVGRTGGVEADPEGAPQDARAVGAGGLYATDDRPGERLGVRQGDVVWEKPIGEVFPEGTTSDTGWAFRLADDVYVGQMAANPQEDRDAAVEGRPFTTNATNNSLVGFSATDGEVLWTSDASTYRCLPDDGRVFDVLPLVRCTFAGTARYDEEGEVVSTESLVVTVEGFDPTTGEARWSRELPAAAAEAVVRGILEVPVTEDSLVVLPSDDGAVLVDTRTGEEAAAGPDAAFACRSDQVELEYAVPWLFGPDGEPDTDRLGGFLLRPCDITGDETDAFSVSAVRDAGADAGEDRFVLAVEGRLLGYDLASR